MIANNLVKLVATARTQTDITRFINSPSQALILYGPSGSGAFSIANELSLILLNLQQDELSYYPYFSVIEKQKDKSEISINQIRAVINELSKTTTGNNNLRRVVIIRDAQLMNVEAQNALLKVLEEPPSDTLLILTSTQLHDLLPTVVSRMQHIKVGLLSKEESIEIFSATAEPEIITRAWQISGGKARLMHELLEEGETHSRLLAVQQAKLFISSDVFTRMTLIDSLSKDKHAIKELLEALTVVISVLQRRPNQSDTQAKRLLHMQKEVIYAQNALESNGQVKLILLRLCTHL